VLCCHCPLSSRKGSDTYTLPHTTRFGRVTSSLLLLIFVIGYLFFLRKSGGTSCSSKTILLCSSVLRTEHKLPRLETSKPYRNSQQIDIQVLGGPQPQDRNISPHICFLTVIPRRAVHHTPPTQASRCHFTTFRETSFIQKQAGLFIITNTPFSIMPIDYHFSYARFAAATVPTAMSNSFPRPKPPN